MNQPRLSCGEAFARLDDYLDRELTTVELAQVERHLELCVACSGEFGVEARVLGEIRAKLRRIRAPSDLLTRIAARLKLE